MNAQKENIDFSTERKYGAGAFYYFYTIALLIFPVCVAIVYLTTKQSSGRGLLMGILVTVCFESSLLFVAFIKLNYFIIDQEKITVRNYYNQFKNDAFYLNTIQSVNIKKGRGRGWIYVEMIDKDLHSTLIRADSVSETNLRTLRKDLIGIGISVNVIDLYIGRLD